MTKPYLTIQYVTSLKRHLKERSGWMRLRGSELKKRCAFIDLLAQFETGRVTPVSWHDYVTREEVLNILCQGEGREESQVEALLTRYNRYISEGAPESQPEGLLSGIRKLFGVKLCRKHQIPLTGSICCECSKHYSNCIRLLHDISALLKARRLREEFWRGLEPRDFEVEVSEVFKRHGWTVRHVGGANDGGVDISMSRGNETGIVQCKRTKAPCGPRVVREMLGTQLRHSGSKAIIVSTSGFSEEASRLAKESNISIIDVTQLCDMAQGP